MKLLSLFTEHPKSVDENYFEHLIFALKFAITLACAAMAALVHALLPFMFEKTASRLINKMHTRIHSR